MAPLSLKIVLDDGVVTRKVKFDNRTTVDEAHAIVKDKFALPDGGRGYMLFLRSANDDKSGVWLEGHRALDYYMLRDGDSLDYLCRYRNLRVRMLDGTVKTLQVDEAKPVGHLMMTVCARIGITNYDEYGLLHDEEDEPEDSKQKEQSTGTLTLKRKAPQKQRDEALDKLNKKIKTDDNVVWLDQHRTLRELGVDPKETLLLKRRLFYSDRNVDSRDPVQLNLLYVQTRDAILSGQHAVTEEQAAEFAGIQCQIHFGDFQEDKHKPGFIENLQEYLPVNFSSSWGVEKKIMKAYRKHQGLQPLEAKVLYIKTARDLPTYGVTFFLVKEKQKDKKKLVPRLLGISAKSILRLDENTKEILQQWPLTHVKTYHVGKSETFTLNFGDYSDKEYAVKTQDAHRIRDILEGYIDLIRRRMLAQSCVMQDESMAIGQDTVEACKGNIMQNITHNATKVVSETFVGPSKLVPFAEGSQPQQGTQIVTMQQIIVADHAKNKQEILKGEVPLRGDMSMNCIRKLNRFNSNAVKIVTLLTEPSQATISEALEIVNSMKDDLPAVEAGMTETAERQESEDMSKKMMDEVQDLKNYLNKLSYALAPGQEDVQEAKQTAEDIAGLSAQMYFSVEPRSRRRSELLNRSRKSFIAGEKTDATLRRASFIAAATTALQTLDFANQALNAEYRGPKLSEEEQRQLERRMEDQIAKLNAALALYLTAHADSKNIDYPAAINSMNTINELMPEIARDAQILASCKDAEGRKELEDDLRNLFVATKKICSLTGTDDHEQMQEASNTYADVAGKLIFTFSRGRSADKENEIIDLAKEVGEKTSQLLVAANQLTEVCAEQPAAEALDDAGVRAALAARDLLATAQLTAPAVREAHCRSALAAAAEGLSSAVRRLALGWKPLLEAPRGAHWEPRLRSGTMDVAQALDRLKRAYEDWDDDVEMEDDSSQERQRLKFISSASGAKNNLQNVEGLWDQSKSAPSEKEKSEAQRRLAQMIAQLNAAIAALASANSDRTNPDYATAELAMTTINELLPQIVKDADTASHNRDEATRNGMQKQIKALCDACRDICASADDPEGLNDAASNFSSASGRLVFLVSPTADKGKKKQMVDLSSTVGGKVSDMIGHVRRLVAEVGGDEAKKLDKLGNVTLAQAHALLTTAQVTAPSIGDARCQSALVSATEQLRSSADAVAATCGPQLLQRPQLRQDLTRSHQDLQNYLDAMVALCQSYKDDADAESDDPQQKKQRLKFISTVSGVKNRLQDAENQLKEPPPCAMMKEADAIAHQNRLAQQLARLNAAIAALATALADRENPDYAAAEKAMNTISEMMPQVVQDSMTASALKDSEDQAKMLQQLRELCDASKAICDGIATPEELNEAACKYATASRKLKFLISPGASNPEENQILDLSSAACSKASELLSHVHQLTSQVAANDAEELDRKGAQTADAAQALLTTAQVTAPSIADEHCRRAVLSSAQQLSSSAHQLAAACEPHARPGQLRDHLQGSHKQLQDTLQLLNAACEECGDGPAAVEKRRLRFITSAAGAKDRLRGCQDLLKQPVASAPATDEEAVRRQRRLAQQLARLNAAIAALTAAVADREKPDYASANEAVDTIAELMPQVAQDARAVAATMDGVARQQLLQQARDVCDAGLQMCGHANEPEALNEAANKYATVSNKMKLLIDPSAEVATEDQVLQLSSAACGRASELLSQVQQLTSQVSENVADELDRKGAHTADAAQALLSVAQVTAPSISEPGCRKVLVSAADKLGKCADELNSSCAPHAQAPLRGNLQHSHQQLRVALKMLTDACDECSDDPAAVEKRRLRFITSAAGAKDKLRGAQQLLNQPLASTPATKEEAARLQQRLSQQLARLNAAIAALAAAVADRENPDYASANASIATIAELMPQVAQDSRALAATKDSVERAQLLQQAHHICEAGQDICAHADRPEALNDAAAKYVAAFSKMKHLIDPSFAAESDSQIVDLSSAACGKATEMLCQVQQLTAQLPQQEALVLDQKGAHTADAAQALLSIAQVTAPSMAEPGCRKALVAAADKLGECADELNTSCTPHARAQPLRDCLQHSHQQLRDSLKMLTEACEEYNDDPTAVEKRRLRFINSAAGAKDKLRGAQELLKEPVAGTQLSKDEASRAQQRLAQQLARLNAAVAALAAAVSDRGNPDYTSANKAVTSIAELMPQVAEDCRAVAVAKDGASRDQLLEQARSICDVAQDICAHPDEPEALNESAVKYATVYGKIRFLIDPIKESDKENQVIQLSSAACSKASELLSHVQQLTSQVAANDAEELDRKGAQTADAAQALLTSAQVTAPSMSEPSCRKVLVGAAEKLGKCADELNSSCAPHAQAPLRGHLQHSHQQLRDTLKMLTDACVTQDEGLPVEEKQRLRFVCTTSAAKNRLQAAEEQLNKPVLCSLMTEEDASKLQQQLSRNVGQLKDSVNKLTAAVADRHKPDYVVADQAVKTISELTPKVVQESRTVCSFKGDEGQAEILQQLRQLCAAAKAICAGAADSQGLSEETDKFNKAADKLVFLVSPAEKAAAQTQDSLQGKKRPAPAVAVRSGAAHATQHFLDMLRADASQDIEQPKIASGDAKCPYTSKTDDEKSAYQEVDAAMADADKTLSSAEQYLTSLHNADSVTIAGEADHSAQIARTEQRMEEALALAGVEVAALVAANYDDKMDYKAALKPATTLPRLVNDIVEDGSIVCTSLEDKPRRAFLKDLLSLCTATRTLCGAVTNENEKLNAAAIDFGNYSSRLLRVVSCDVNPALEKEVISRAKLIGDTASRLAVEAGSVATADRAAAAAAATAAGGDAAAAHVQHMCSAGRRHADAAGKLVYTAKCVAPSIYHPTCQETLVAAADQLSNNLDAFTKSWKPICNAESLKTMTEEADKLEKLLESLRNDVKTGKLSRKWMLESEVDLDTPLKQMTVQIIDDAEKMCTNPELSAEERKEYGNYVRRLRDALRALNNANARCQRAPHDRARRTQLDNAVQELQATLLLTRPCRARNEQANVVDLREFLQELATRAEQMGEVAVKHSTVASKKPTEHIRSVCERIQSGAEQLMSDAGQHYELTDDTMDHNEQIDQFAEECEEMVKELDSTVTSIGDKNLVAILNRKLLLVTESCNLLKFAAKTAISTAEGAAYEAAMSELDDLNEEVVRPILEGPHREVARRREAPRARAGVGRVAAEAARAQRGRPAGLARAALDYGLVRVFESRRVPVKTVSHLEAIIEAISPVVKACYVDNANCRRRYKRDLSQATGRILEEMKSSTLALKAGEDSQQEQVVNEEDVRKLLMPTDTETVTGTKKELEEQLQQLASKASSIGGTVVLSVRKRSSLARSLHATADAAHRLRRTACALAAQNPAKRKRIEDDAHEMCYAAYNLLMTSELVSHDPNHQSGKRRLLDACRALNDAINTLVRSVAPAGAVRRQCWRLARDAQLRQAALQAAPQPHGAGAYAHCSRALRRHLPLIQNLDSEVPMKPEEFLGSLDTVASAIDSSAESAAHCAYLLSVSESDQHLGKEGLIDVPELHKLISDAHDSCIDVISCKFIADAKEEKKKVEKNIEELVKALNEATEKTNSAELKVTLKRDREHLEQAAKELYTTIDQSRPRATIISQCMRVLGELQDASAMLEQSELLPPAAASAAAQALADDVLENTRNLLTKTQDLIKEVKSTPEEQEVMKWVMFTKRKSVIDAFEALLKSVRSCGHRAKFLEAEELDGAEQKSYIQTQVEIVKKWLLKPAPKVEAKKAGQEAVTNIILIASKMNEDLQGAEKEEMTSLVSETMTLLKECSIKPNQEKNSLLMDRVRELHKMIERGVVTRLVEDFMDAEMPLQDLDILADAERDPAKRKFLLEKKIAELQAQLSRVSRTARLLGSTGGGKLAEQLGKTSNQAELLAPKLVKAAEQRINSPDDKAAIEHYQALLAQYADSLAKLRELCDQSVDPMDFVQTAGETMQRMREESSNHNDPMKCYQTSQAITKLANRVMHVGLASSMAREPELARALAAAQAQLARAAPEAPPTASRMPDWDAAADIIMRTTGEVEAVLGGETIFKKQPETNQPIYNEALNLHEAVRGWSSRDNEIVAVAKRMAVLMAKLSDYMNRDKQCELLATSKSIVAESHEVTRLAKKLAHECSDARIKNNLLRSCEKIPTISGQLKMLTTVKASSLGQQSTHEDQAAMDMLVNNAQGLMISIQDVIKAAASASVKIMSQRGTRMKWVRRNYY